ncbi:MAG: FtsX-like permease family protein [Candidatus Saccharibacteria bacterium]
MKTIDIISMASSNMRRSKLRTSLTVVAIFVGAFTITLTIGISSGISSYIDKQLGSLGAEDALIVRPTVKNPMQSSEGLIKYNPDSNAGAKASTTIGMPMINQSDMTKIRQQNGIISVEPMLMAKPSFIQGANQQKYETEVMGTIEGVNFDLATGHNINNNKNEVLLPAKYVKPLGFSSKEEAIGKTVTFGLANSSNSNIVSIPAVVVGVPQDGVFGSARVNVSHALISEMYDVQTIGLPDSLKNQHIAAIARFDKNISENELVKLKKDLLEKGYTATTIEDEIGIVKQIINAITYVLVFFGAIALLAACFGIINTLFMSVQERTKEIGLMKAMGMNKNKIFMLFSFEAILIGFWGSLFGVLAAIGVGKIVNSVATKSFLKDLQGFNLTVFSLAEVSLVILLIVTIAFLSGTLPARRAARLDPIDALRYE